MDSVRLEEDLLGAVEFNKDCLHGIATERALRCSSIGAQKVPSDLVRTLGLVKFACACANEDLGLLDHKTAALLKRAALEIYEGKYSEAFPLEIFQTGGCTPINMNVNEVIKNLAKKADASVAIHANDDVNMGQSTNDVIPTALNIILRELSYKKLLPALKHCFHLLEEKENLWKDVIVLGRTHTMDAVLMTLGQIFSGYKRQVEKDMERITANLSRFLELPIGGTAVGNEINSHPNFGQKTVNVINEKLTEHYVMSKNRYEQQSSRDDYVFFAGLLDTVMTTFIKLANDIRWYGSGPSGGINELILPMTQAGSSCMPGKINPVVCETLLQVCIYVQGHCEMVRKCAVIGGQFQLNTTSMLLIYALIESINVFSKALNLFCEKLLKDLQPNYSVIKTHIENSPALLMSLAPQLGYDKVAAIVQDLKHSSKTVLEVLKQYCPGLDLAEILKK